MSPSISPRKLPCFAIRLLLPAIVIMFAASACGGGGAAASIADEAARLAAQAARLAAANADEAARVVVAASDETARAAVVAADEAAHAARAAADEAARAAAAASDEAARTGASDAAEAALIAAGNADSAIVTSAQFSKTFAQVVGQWQRDLILTSQWNIFLNETQEILGRLLSSEEIVALKDIFLEVTCVVSDSNLVETLIEREKLKEKLNSSLPGLAGIPNLNLDLALIESRDTIEEQFVGFVRDYQLEAVIPGVQLICQIL
jgi:hypothetical protein